MNTSELVEWQIIDNDSGLVFPWLTHPFLYWLKEQNLCDKTILEFGAGRSTAWWRHNSYWVDSIESNEEWGNQAIKDCESYNLHNGRIFCKTLPDGVQDKKKDFFDLIPTDKEYDVIVVDGIWRYECLEWALSHFKGKGGLLIADNWNQDFVWISPPAEELMKPYKINKFIQPNHTNHEGNPWKTVYWNIPA